MQKILSKQNFPDKNKKVIAFHPGAGKDANIWDINYFIKLIKKLYKQFGNYVLITSGWTDEKIVEQICTELSRKTLNIRFCITIL